MSARSGLVGKNHPGPIWGHLGPFFAWAGKIQKMPKFCVFSLVVTFEVKHCTVVTLTNMAQGRLKVKKGRVQS